MKAARAGEIQELHMLKKTWWLLALCGVMDAMCAAGNLLMLGPDGTPILRRFALPNTVWDMSLLAVVAGACLITAGLWNSGRGDSWLLSLHGLGLGAFGLIGISPLVRGPLSFRPISLLFVLMSFSVGAYALRTAQTMRGGAPGRWLLSLAGAVSVGFAFSFVAAGFGWVRLGGPHSFWIWMSSYFSLCAILMLFLALHVRSQGVVPSSPSEILAPIRNPRHAQ
jgi:hypothetical protein